MRKLTWAEHVGPDGRPALMPGKRPAAAYGDASLRGATDRSAKSLDLSTRLFRTMASEY